jgi:negative regulator of replication initiation
MSPHIELDEEIFEFLKANAEPFVDTPNTVLRRLLGLDSATIGTAKPVVAANRPVDVSEPRGAKATKKTAKSAKPKRTRAATGTLLREERYELPLLKALEDAGGQAPYRDVVDAVGRELKDDLLPADFENLNSGAVRWQSRLQFVRLRLIERGYLDKNAPRGVWAITDAGRSALAEGERS